MSIPLLKLFLGALVLVAGPSGSPAAVAQQAGGGRWETVDLPAGFELDLESGVVASRHPEERPTLRYGNGSLSSLSPLRLLPPSMEVPRVRVDRDGGEAVPGAPATVGQELVFDAFDRTWGYLRVLEVGPLSVRLVLRLEGDLARRELRREPGALAARSGREGVDLSWEAEAGALYRGERRPASRGPGQPPASWASVAQVSGGAWRDDRLDLAHFNEYRVSRLGQGGGFGSTASGVAGIEPPDARVEVGPGTELNLLSATTDDLRVDLTVEYVRSNGVQLAPGEGVEGRTLSTDEESNWVLSQMAAGTFRKQKFFVPPDRVLALRLPEGVHVLLRIEGIEDQKLSLTRQVDVSGERVFPPAPETPSATWKPGRGVRFEFGEPRKLPPSGEPILVLEREATLEAGDWAECARGAPGERHLVDPEVGEQLLVRYRFRQGLEGSQLSPASEPLTVLVGGDSDEAREALLERAILDLGSDDYDRRRRARAVLLAMGDQALQILLDALRSENAELAASARELLQAGIEEGQGDAGNLARLLISIRAEEVGLSHPPHPDWVAQSPGARASAALRGLGWRNTPAARIAEWRHVLAEADPEEAVRSTAGLAALLGAQGLGPDLGPRFPSQVAENSVGDEWLVDLELDGPAAPEPSMPWTRLVELQARHEVEARSEDSSEELARAREHAVLARYLAAHFERTRDPLFLDCALRVIEDPIARLRGAVDFAQSQSLPDSFKAEGAVQVVRLEAPDTALLLEELDLLRDGDLRGIEFVLPAGIYEPLPDGRQIVLEGATFRLRGEGQVELHTGFTLMKGCEAIFENLEIVPESGIGVNVVKSRLVARDCLIRGGHLGLLGTDAVVELVRTALVTPRSSGPSADGARFGGRSMLLASASRIESPDVAIFGAQATLLDRCVVLSEGRVAIEGTPGSDLWVINSLVQAERTPFTRVTRGVLDGAVLYGEVAPALRGAAGLQVCSEHLRCDAELSQFGRELWLERCALGH